MTITYNYDYHYCIHSYLKKFCNRILLTNYFFYILVRVFDSLLATLDPFNRAFKMHWVFKPLNNLRLLLWIFPSLSTASHVVHFSAHNFSTFNYLLFVVIFSLIYRHFVIINHRHFCGCVLLFSLLHHAYTYIYVHTYVCVCFYVCCSVANMVDMTVPRCCHRFLGSSNNFIIFIYEIAAASMNSYIYLYIYMCVCATSYGRHTQSIS